MTEPVLRRQRETWADVAKAACILLVVFYHVGTKDVVALPGLQDTAAARAWDTGTRLLTPLRMPLFFLVSGYFASRAVLRPWRATVRSRVLGNLYLHLMWLLVAALVHQVFG